MDRPKDGVAQRQRLRALAGESWWARALWGTSLICLILTAVVLWVQYAGSSTDQRILVTFLINVLAVVGLQVFMGNSDIPSFGHVAFVALGAYVGAIVMTPSALKSSPFLIPHAPAFIRDVQVGFIPALIIALVIVAALAALSGLAIVRLNGGPAAIASLAVLMIVQSWLGNWTSVTHGPQTWAGIPNHTTVWIALLVTAIGIFVARCFRESGPGLMLRASRKEELASGAVGVNVRRERYLAWVLSAVIAGTAGVLWAGYFLAVSPDAFSFDLTFMYIVMVIIGGTSVSGAVVGAGFVTVVNELTRRTQTSGVHFLGIDVSQVYGLTPIVLSLLVLLATYFRPGGILGRWELDEVIVRARRGRKAPGGDARVQTSDDPGARRVPVNGTDKRDVDTVNSTESRGVL
jgi:branched-chain amino acid transport system permease protein